METQDFVMILLGKHSAIKKTIKGWDAHEYARLAKLTEHVKFDCDFNKAGLCKVYRDKYNTMLSDRDSRMCCCNNCAHTVGYLESVPNDTRILDKYAKLYSEKTGFWRAGGGCNLPREMRSTICLTYNCASPAAESIATKTLFFCLRGKKGSMCGKQYQYQVVDHIKGLFKEEAGR